MKARTSCTSKIAPTSFPLCFTVAASPIVAPVHAIRLRPPSAEELANLASRSPK